jgi:hypothetical protein
MRQGYIHQTRKIRPTRRSVSGIYAFRGQTSIPYESTLERDFLIRAEFFAKTCEIIPQPVRIPFLGRNGQTFTYTPDFLVRFAQGSQDADGETKPQLVEVKPSDEWREHWRKWATKWKAARRFAIERGWTFRIFDESRIRDQVLINIRFLDRFKRMAFEETRLTTLVEQVQLSKTIALQELLRTNREHDDQHQVAAQIWHLVAVRRMDCQMNAPLTTQTTLWMPSNG